MPKKFNDIIKAAGYTQIDELIFNIYILFQVILVDK